MGITTKLDCYPAEGLGGLRLGVSPLEMARRLRDARLGRHAQQAEGDQKVEFPDGKSEDLGKPERKRVFTDGVAYEVTKILEQNVQGGTGTAANVGCPAAGKTGTTDNFNDAWFVGYTPHLATLGLGRLPERAGLDGRDAHRRWPAAPSRRGSGTTT